MNKPDLTHDLPSSLLCVLLCTHHGLQTRDANLGPKPFPVLLFLAIGLGLGTTRASLQRNPKGTHPALGVGMQRSM